MVGNCARAPDKKKISKINFKLLLQYYYGGGYMASSDEHFEDELAENDYKKVLHEPVAPHLTHVYTTLTHLVQSLVLAAIFYVITVDWGQLNLLIVFNLIICVTIGISIWYGYLTNSQYFTIRASIFNVLIIVATGICQVALALVVAQPIYIFTLFFALVALMLSFQFLDNIIKHKKPIAIKIWKQHFKKLGSQFAQDLFDEVRKFEYMSGRNGFIFAGFTGILTLFNFYFPLSLEIKGFITFIILLTFLIVANYYSNLNRYLNNSEKLKKYGYEW